MLANETTFDAAGDASHEQIEPAAPGSLDRARNIMTDQIIWPIKPGGTAVANPTNALVREWMPQPRSAAADHAIAEIRALANRRARLRSLSSERLRSASR